MKKNKKKFVPNEPRINDTTKDPGSVAELIELLQSFPEDGKVELDGMINIDFGEDGGVDIYPKKVLDECGHECNEEQCICDECANVDEVISKVMEDIELHVNGTLYNNHEQLKNIRNMSSDSITAYEIMAPNPFEYEYEINELHPNQAAMIDEIRKHNAFMAECMAELHRREISALLEYNTQCLAHFGVETNRDMCVIIDKNKMR